MKGQLLIACLAGLMALTSRAGVIYSARSGTIPDGNPAGWAATATFSDELPVITGVTVDLSISGGYNGDLYAYLSFDGKLLPLLNRVGVGTGGTRTDFGYSDTGMNIRLSDSGGNNIHFYQEVTDYSITGGATWKPDGRAIDPLSSAGNFNAGGTVSFLSQFQGRNPNNVWTLFLADMSGGEQSQLVSWSLNITSEVPEPVNVALGIFAGVFLVVALARSQRVRNRIYQWRAAVVAWINAV